MITNEYGIAIGYYVDCDSAICADCAPAGFPSGDYSEWEGFEGWESPSAIFIDSESDTPTHCSREDCGQLIPHDLTSEGMAYVTDRLERALNDGDIGDCLPAWMDQYGDSEHGCDLPANYLDAFTYGYAHTMLWANLSDSRDTEGRGCKARPEDWQTPSEGWQLAAFSPDSQRLIKADCADFVRSCWQDLAQLPASYGRANNGNPDAREIASSAGHDFALTRNHHGTGFWDRGIGELGERLTKAAHPYGESGAWYDGAAFDDGNAVVYLDDANDAPES